MSPPLSAAELQANQDHGQRGSSHFSSSLTYPRSASVLGYCLLPLVLVAILGIVVPLDGFFGYLLTSLAIVWCAYSSSSMFTIVGKFSETMQIHPRLTQDRTHDFNERLGGVSHGTVLWKLWNNGNFQLEGCGNFGEGRNSGRIDAKALQGISKARLMRVAYKIGLYYPSDMIACSCVGNTNITTQKVVPRSFTFVYFYRCKPHQVPFASLQLHASLFTLLDIRLLAYHNNEFL